MQEQHSSRAGDRLGIWTSALVHAGGLAGGRVQEAQTGRLFFRTVRLITMAPALRSVFHGVHLRKGLHGVQRWPPSLAGRGLCMSLSLWQALLWRRGRRASPLGLLWLTSPPSRLFFWGLPWICMAMLRR